MGQRPRSETMNRSQLGHDVPIWHVVYVETRKTMVLEVQFDRVFSIGEHVVVLRCLATGGGGRLHSREL